jgi:hypothetical protein
MMAGERTSRSSIGGNASRGPDRCLAGATVCYRCFAASTLDHDSGHGRPVTSEKPEIKVATHGYSPRPATGSKAASLDPPPTANKTEGFRASVKTSALTLARLPWSAKRDG